MKHIDTKQTTVTIRLSDLMTLQEENAKLEKAYEELQFAVSLCYRIPATELLAQADKIRSQKIEQFHKDCERAGIVRP